MHTKKRSYFRNRLDLSDSVQVRVIKRRLGVSEPELAKLVGRMGNSLSAISKEVALRQATEAAAPAKLPAAVAIEATKEIAESAAVPVAG
jgi:Protein of unknown function (DUF3606)